VLPTCSRQVGRPSQHLPPWRRQETRREPLDRVAGVQHQPGPTVPAVLFTERPEVVRVANYVTWGAEMFWMGIDATVIVGLTGNPSW
jgi:hypothetical protein